MPSAGSQDKGHLKESFGGESTRYLKKLQCRDDTTKEVCVNVPKLAGKIEATPSLNRFYFVDDRDIQFPMTGLKYHG